MSVFRVQLANAQQGLLDVNMTTGVPVTTSIQRTIYVTGPGKTYRKLADGQTFTDCNYWKRFAYPQVALADAFINVVTDDGSVYSDDSTENSFPLVYNLAPAGGSTYADNVVDILGDTSSYAHFVQIVNQSGSQNVRVKVNGSSSAIFDLAHGETQVFNAGDLQVSQLSFDNSTSGATTGDIQVILSVKSVCSS